MCFSVGVNARDRVVQYVVIRDARPEFLQSIHSQGESYASVTAISTFLCSPLFPSVCGYPVRVAVSLVHGDDVLADGEQKEARTVGAHTGSREGCGTGRDRGVPGLCQRPT